VHLSFPKYVGICLLILSMLCPARASALTPTMGVDQLQRGTRGIGKTVLHGTRIDTFEVEILGVLRNAFGPKTDIILARLSGARLETTGGIAGMSGSPVYVEGHLIGAVAYGWSFSIEPIMGITPIAEMLDIMDRPDPVLSRQSGFSLPDDVQRGLAKSQSQVQSGQMVAVKTPVYLSGYTADVIPDLQEALMAFGLMPVQGGGGLDTTLAEAKLEPGAALGVQLVRGDFNMTAIGTVTHVDGDRVIGFGHPMFSSGSTRLPMTTAFIHDVIASQLQSFKLGSAVKQVGAITQDRAPGIGGVIGQETDMMPISITIESPGRTEAFAMEVLRNRDLTSVLVQSAVVSSLISAEKARGDVTVKTAVTIAFPDRPELTIENVYSGARGLGEGVLGVTRPMQLLLQNPFETVEIEKVSFSLTVAEDVDAALIESIALDRSRFEPGDTIGIQIGLRPFLQDTVSKRVSVVIPKHVRRGTLTLRVSSARAHAAQESKRIPGAYRVSDVDGLLHVLEGEYRNDQLVVELLANRGGATVDGRELSSLPPSVLGAMKGSRKSGSVRAVNQSVLVESVLETPYVLSGQQTVFLNIGADGPALRFSPGPSTSKKK
jgi:hypothetical protein